MKPVETPTRAPRRHDVPLFIRLGDIPMGRTRNMSRSGVFLETRARPPVDSRHELCLAWGDTTYTCKARIVRHADDGIGVAFEEVDSLFAQAIGEIMAEAATPTGRLDAVK